jgi:hypothetical protein
MACWPLGQRCARLGFVDRASAVHLRRSSVPRKLERGTTRVGGSSKRRVPQQLSLSTIEL